MSTNPNTVKSQDEINQGGRKSDVLVEAISKLEITTKQLEIALDGLKSIAYDEYVYETRRHAQYTLEKIRELDK